ncbi:MAG: hypothetical protein K0V04_28660, partial [Deltaproteobacteria bacterium]|nr:hypothetical protein [Deltaproteobacteria bacterium]
MTIKSKLLGLSLLSALSLVGSGDAYAGPGDIDVDDTLNNGAIGSSNLAGTMVCPNPGIACFRQAVVAFRTNTGDLKVTLYEATGITTTAIERSANSTEGSISSNSPIAMTSVPPPTAITPARYAVGAFQDNGGDLMLIVWSPQSLARRGDNVLSGFPGNAINEVAVTSVSHDIGNPDSSDRVVTAARTAAGNLQLTSWDIIDLPATSDVDVIEL